MVPEYGEGVSRNGSRCHVDYYWGQFTGDLEHVGEHQEKTLRCGEGCAQRTGRE